MPIILYPGTDNYSTVTVSGLYDNNTESPLFAASGSTVPTSGLVVGGTCAQGNFETIQLDQSFNLLTFPGIQFVAGQAWSSATTINTVQYVYLGNTTEGPKTGAPAYVIQLDQTTPITTGAVTFEGTYDNINWVSIPTGQILNPNTFASLTNPYTFVPSTNQPFLIVSQGYAQIRIQLTSTITGAGTVTPYWSALSYVPQLTSMGSSTVSGTLSNNNAAPTNNNLGVLGFIAETAYSTITYTTGNQVLAVTDLHGALNTDMQAIAGVAIGPTSVVNFGSSPAAAPVQAVNSSIFSGTTALTNTGGALNVNITNATGPFTVAGNLSNNTAAPIADNVGVLPAIAATSYTTNTYTNGNQVLLVTDLHGAVNDDLQAVAGVQLGATAVTAFGTAPAAVNVPAVNSANFVEVAGTPTAVSGTGTSMNVNITNTSVPIAGTLTNNNAAPIANNLGVLGFLINGAAVGTPPTPETYTSGNQALATISDGGSLVQIPADEYYASKISNFGTDTGVTVNNPSGNVPILSIRSSSAAINFLVRSIQGATNGALGVFRLYKNPTLTGATFAATAPTGSHVTVDTAATAFSSVGTQLWSGYSGTGSVINQQMLQYLAAGAPGDIISLGWQKVGSGTANPYGAINWSEESVNI